MRKSTESKPNTETRSRDAISPDVGKPGERYSFRDLSPDNQHLARSRFVNAGPGDAYLYELDIDSRVISRRHIHFTH